VFEFDQMLSNEECYKQAYSAKYPGL